MPFGMVSGVSQGMGVLGRVSLGHHIVTTGDFGDVALPKLLWAGLVNIVKQHATNTTIQLIFD